MQDMVKQIVDMDRKAREITDAAQLEKVNSEKEVAQKRDEIRAEYLERARKRISLNEPKERVAAEVEWKTVMQKNTVLSQSMDNLYSEKGDEWVKKIIARVIGE